ncbi:MAG: hypothetical protein LBT47_12715 [Deltaproteobacteria bacterium]|jgi:hypothetical protein|nr:hypothetical protein [Deltaproteobacteria bacterium]
MSVDDRDSRSKNTNNSGLLEDSDYGDDSYLDLEMERIIKQLDDVTAEGPQAFESQEERPVPTIAARTPVPARDPHMPKDAAETVLLTDKFEQRSVPVRPKTGSGAIVVDLVDEVSESGFSDTAYGEDDDRSLGRRSHQSRTVAELTVDELEALIDQVVERAMRRFYTR